MLIANLNNSAFHEIYASTYTTPIGEREGKLVIDDEYLGLTKLGVNEVTSIGISTSIANSSSNGNRRYFYFYNADTYQQLFYMGVNSGSNEDGKYPIWFYLPWDKDGNHIGRKYNASHSYASNAYNAINAINGFNQPLNAADVYHVFDSIDCKYLAEFIATAFDYLGIYTESGLQKNMSIVSDGHGTVSNNSGYYETGTSISTTATPYSGYSFTGWYSGETLVSMNNPYTFIITQDITLMAKFQANTYTINYNSDGGSTCNSKTVTFGSAYGTLPTPTKTGYSFSGWRTETGTIVTSESLYTTATNTTLTAVWSTNNYSVQLLNTGTGASSAANEQSFGSTVVINAGTKAGYWFTGWNVISGLVNLADITASTTTFSMPANNLILQATWNQITSITVTLNDKFTSTYSSCFNGEAYDVDRGITVTPDMVEVYINFEDGTKVKTNSFSLTSNNIVAIGENQVTATLDGFAYSNTVKVIGYSASLSAVMQSLGLHSNDYKGLAALISVMKNNIESAKNEIRLYQKNLDDIKAALAAGGIEVTLGTDLVDNLQKTLAGINNAVARLDENELELQIIQSAVNKLLSLYGESLSTDGEFTTILSQLEQLQTDIANLKQEVETLTSFVNDLKILLGLESAATLDTIYNEILIIKTGLIKAEEEIETYENAIDSINSTLGEAEESNDQTALVDKLNVITTSLVGVKNELADMQTQLTSLISESAALINGTEESSETGVTVTDINSAISELRTKITVLTQNTNQLTDFISSIKNSIGLESNATSEEILKELNNIRTLLNYIREKLNLPSIDSGTSLTLDGNEIIESITTLNSNMEEIRKALQLSDVDTIESILGEITELQTANERLSGELNLIKENLGISDSEAVVITDIISKIDQFYNDFEEIAGSLGLRETATKEEVLAEIDNIRILLNDIRTEVGLPTVATGSSISLDGGEIVASIVELNNNIEEIISVLHLSEEGTIKDIISTITQLQETKERLSENLDNIKDELGISDSEASSISEVLSKIDRLYLGYEEIAKSLGISLDVSNSLSDNISLILGGISTIQGELAAAGEALLNIISMLDLGTLNPDELATSLGIIKEKILELQNQLAVTESELNIANAKTITTTTGKVIEIYSVSFNQTALGNMVAEKNGTIAANDGYQVCSSAYSSEWTDSTEMVRDEDIEYIYIRNIDHDELVFMAVRGIESTITDYELVETSDLVEVSISNEDVRITTKASNDYFTKIKDDLIITAIPKDNVSVYYQLVEKDEDLSSDWTIVENNSFKVSDCQESRIYIKAVSSNGSYTIQKTTGFTINTMQNFLNGIEDGKSYNQDVTIEPLSDNIYRIEVDGIITEKDRILNLQKSYEIVVTLNDGNKKRAIIRIDKIPPLLEGVEAGETYAGSVQIRFGDASGVTATLNGAIIESATWVTKAGDYELQLIDGAGNRRTVKFSIDK